MNFFLILEELEDSTELTWNKLTNKPQIRKLWKETTSTDKNFVVTMSME